MEQNLDRMQGLWTSVKFEYTTWQATGTYIIRGVDDLQIMLEEHFVKTQSMQTSLYISPFEDRVKLWLAKLNLVQEVCMQGQFTGFWNTQKFLIRLFNRLEA